MFYVGIDVAKNKHDCCILSENGEVLSTFTFANDRAGFESLISKISGHSKQKGFC
jgi:transposase